MNIIFFGSTSDSVIVLEKLLCYSTMKQCNNVTISCVVTQPPTPIGRKQVITPTSVEVYAKSHDIPVLSFQNNTEKHWCYQNEEDVINSISTFKPDLLISASYGQKISSHIMKEAQFGGLNVHPSLLPRWRGADPIPWTILSGDRQTGVTIVTLSEKFDQGRIIAQKKITANDNDFSDPLRSKLFTMGAGLLIESLPDYLSGENKGSEQKLENGSVARKLIRDDGFIPWNIIQSAMENSTTIEQCNNETMLAYLKKQTVVIPQNLLINTWILRMIRALSLWPGVWTLINPTNPTNLPAGKAGLQIRQMKKRVKILQAHVENGKLILDSVQLEGKKPIKWKQFKNSYLLSLRGT